MEMIVEKIKKISVVLLAVLIIGGAFSFGAYYGYSNRPYIDSVVGLDNKETLKPDNVDFEPFWQAWEMVNRKFVSRDELDNQKLVYGAIEGMVKATGDPYTMFFPPEESKMFQEEMSGNFEGVGMEIGIRSGILTVIAPMKGTPAFKAGVKSGDKIIKIGDKMTNDMSSEEAARLIRGPGGSKIKITFIREKAEKPIELEITRENIKIPVIDTEEKDNGIFVIKMYSFSATSAMEFRNALRKFAESGSHKLILDLRNNPGGYLEASIDMASWFLPAGKIVVREKFSEEKGDEYRSRGYDAFDKRFGLKMIILVNEGSASASEILAGALQEHGIAKLVGTKTFGKGSVQEMIPLTSDTSLKITIAKWLTPNGKSISDEGLEPDYKVEITEKDAEKLRDTQMEKALELLKDN